MYRKVNELTEKEFDRLNTMNNADIKNLEDIHNKLRDINIIMLEILNINLSEEAEKVFNDTYNMDISFEELYYKIFDWYDSLEKYL